MNGIRKRSTYITLAMMALFALIFTCGAPPYAGAQDNGEIVHPIDEGVLSSELVTTGVEVVSDTEVVTSFIDLFGLMGGGASGMVIMIAIISLMMMLLKWDRIVPLFDMLPEWSRSTLPLVLGMIIGILESLLTGAPLWGAIVAGLTAGGVQQVLYQQTKHTLLDTWIRAVTPFISRSEDDD